MSSLVSTITSFDHPQAPIVRRILHDFIFLRPIVYHAVEPLTAINKLGLGESVGREIIQARDKLFTRLDLLFFYTLV